ncbi:MAG TPA: hypothetical protein VIF57_24635 [Polyangia bacterium]
MSLARRHGRSPRLLVRDDERAARAVRAIDEMFAAAPSEEPAAWARYQERFEDHLGRQRRGAWRRGAGVLAVGTVLAAGALVLWKAPGTPEQPRAVPAIVSNAAHAVGAAPAPVAPLATDSEAPPGERPDAAPLAVGTSVLAAGVRAHLSRGGRATYLPSTRGTLVLERGTLEIERDALARADARAADRPLEVRVAGWQVRGGGRFKVAAHGRRVAVLVEQGEVAVWSSVRMVARVVAGERWTSDPVVLAAPAGGGTPEPRADAPAEQRDCLRLARDGVTSDAIACLEEQATASGLTGEIALLELARIRRDVKGDLAGAERLLAEHERRFPRSGLATEARGGRIELLLRLGRPAEALADAQRLDDGEALYWRAVSLAALARRDEARDTFDAYLGRPDIQRRREALRRRDELGR